MSQLQTAIAAFGSDDGPEVTMLREAMNLESEFIARAEKAFGSPHPPQDETGVRFGGWSKSIAAFAHSC